MFALKNLEQTMAEQEDGNRAQESVQENQESLGMREKKETKETWDTPLKVIMTQNWTT